MYNNNNLYGGSSRHIEWFSGRSSEDKMKILLLFASVIQTKFITYLGCASLKCRFKMQVIGSNLSMSGKDDAFNHQINNRYELRKTEIFT